MSLILSLTLCLPAVPLPERPPLGAPSIGRVVPGDGGAPPISLPPLSDLAYFPTRDAAAAIVDFSLAHESHLFGRMNTEPHNRDSLCCYAAEMSERRRQWQLLIAARNPDNSDNSRRECLEALRHRIGPMAYYSGRIPFPADAAAFVSADRTEMAPAVVAPAIPPTCPHAMPTTE